jgi:hypothetical protein
VIIVVLGRRRGVHGTGAIAITRLWRDELDLEVQGVIGLCRWRSYNDEGLWRKRVAEDGQRAG